MSAARQQCVALTIAGGQIGLRNMFIGLGMFEGLWGFRILEQLVSVLRQIFGSVTLLTQLVD